MASRLTFFVGWTLRMFDVMDKPVTLRAVEPNDVDMLYRLESYPDVRRVSFGESPISRQMIWDYVQSYTADIYRDRQLRLMIGLGDVTVGAIDISDFDPANRRAMVGIAIEESYRGKGVGKKALKGVIDFCRETLGMHQLAVLVPKSNETSLRLFKSVGFKISGCLQSWLRSGTSYEDAILLQLML